MNLYLKQYQKNEVETATPERILILLYDGAINFLNKAKIAFEQDDIQQIHNNIMACEKIILEFMNTLNMKEGGELAKNLYRLYDYLYNTLVQANVEKDVEKVNEVLKHLKSLRDTWQKAIEIANGEKKQEIISQVKGGYRNEYNDGYISSEYEEEDDDDGDYDDEEDDDE